ncbi:hypothetical protein [Nitrospirillum sp. BR 11828]|uniref:hypothetical protein n=1 Tax=Nitrospirillum sp. BR 11828 TaxID=3104325 RepID=UPI002ACAEDA7|nr:hypothetical protein [Nitrospirillum sp. BR 11828]MDZ5646641.1 hypothetical protein [Nitrospirillum sp. BR 11828]
MLRKAINYLFFLDEVQALYRGQTGTPREQMAAVKRSAAYQRIRIISNSRAAALALLSMGLALLAVGLKQVEGQSMPQWLAHLPLSRTGITAAGLVLGGSVVVLGLWLGTWWGERRAARLTPTDQ